MRDPECRAVRAPATAAAALGAVFVAVIARAAHGQVVGDSRSNALACMGESQAFVRDHDVGQIRAERDRLLRLHPEPGEPVTTTAYRSCLIAELMRSLGNDGAAEYYAQAIGVSADPGYELRFADYLRNARGPGASLIEQVERHYAAALEGVRMRLAAPGTVDRTIAEWATRGLMLTYQQDGFPLLASNGFPYDSTGSSWPGIRVMAGGSIAVDTNATPLDMSAPPEVDDARRFTAEAMFAASMFRKAQPLHGDELQAIARSPLREELMARGRIRASPMGAIDVWYRRAEIHGGEITSYKLPTQLNDITVSELGAGFTRALDLYPAFDVLLAGDYHRVHRVGAVEFSPDQAQDFNQFGVRAGVARFVGPDKLSLTGGYTFMAIPDVVGGVIADRARGRTIASVEGGYMLNRFLLPPLRLSIVRIFGGVAQDDETFGVRVVRRRDAHLGLGLVRLQRWDVTVQSSVFSGVVDVRPLDSAQRSGEDPQQNNAQYRTTVVVLRRLIDEDAEPGLPPEVLGVRPSMLNAVATVRHDARLSGLYAFQNVRAGLDLWAKVFVTGLRGTAFLMSAGYENQYFYTIGKDLHIFHLDVRMGW